MSKLSESICKILSAILTLAFVLLLGILFFSALFSGFFTNLDIAIVGLGLILSIFVSITVHEGGHLVFGLASGYKFSSFRIAGLMILKRDGKLRIRTMSIAGTGGQCLMLPPEPNANGKIPVTLYNLGGVIANLVLCALFALGYALSLRHIVVAYVFLLSAIISMLMAVTNGIPLHVGGIANDGMNACYLSKNPISAIAFRNQLLMNAAQGEGVRISEMPDEWFVLPDGADMQNLHCASIAVFATGRALDRGDTEAAEREISALLNSGYNIIGLHRALLVCDLIYCRLVNQPGSNISHLLSADVKKVMKAMRTYPAIIRTEFAIAYIANNDEKKATEIKAFFEKATVKFPYPQEIENERLLISKVENIRKADKI